MSIENHKESKETINSELEPAAYAIVDKRNGDIWNVNTEDRLLEAEAQQMGANHVLEDLVRRQDVVDEINRRIESIKEEKVDAAHSRVFELEWLKDKIEDVEKKNAEGGSSE